MRTWSSALAIACLATGAFLLSTPQAQLQPVPAPAPGQAEQPPQPKGPPPAQMPADRFQFRVCNKSSIPLFAAMLYKTGENTWRMHGWAPFKPGTCGPVRGTFPRNDFYWYVEDAPGNVTYSGKDAYGCINSDDGFDRTVTGDYQCASNEKVVGFTKIDEAGIRDGITLTD
jgi:uncharacterized membrane protein